MGTATLIGEGERRIQEKVITTEPETCLSHSWHALISRSMNMQGCIDLQSMNDMHGYDIFTSAIKATQSLETQKTVIERTNATANNSNQNSGPKFLPITKRRKSINSQTNVDCRGRK
ncbi:hypothetical protein CEXT_560661 [Caerostris extrusa]|uniref:Uncharacterized protein n=1 Tax=Caerostris extrusa TaxID=172846 RepID=A0AAV4MCK8_CAEEX|nr:hypothetical protein CEXT_560661 [Caerostris extrusa]